MKFGTCWSGSLVIILEMGSFITVPLCMYLEILQLLNVVIGCIYSWRGKRTLTSVSIQIASHLNWFTLDKGGRLTGLAGLRLYLSVFLHYLNWYWRIALHCIAKRSQIRCGKESLLYLIRGNHCFSLSVVYLACKCNTYEIMFINLLFVGVVWFKRGVSTYLDHCYVFPMYVAIWLDTIKATLFPWITSGFCVLTRAV